MTTKEIAAHKVQSATVTEVKRVQQDRIALWRACQLSSRMVRDAR